ncbi:DUF502 domain-containing protein [Haloferax mediterranei ATCC 33500]|uniref:DUF502 domain-containing protein n=1 Tax=Haloferax mediterranei (strain ATCC 33500 / DSM 1411 / JCM 8866 / NBRC 14739 / NCIMB 2177 / R-4) TaxID=523841 RepID=I3R1E4_HALMT|nr:DUF502 domain-containing protein [Haloferax mediterranei]AFK18054.1 hypothetical protein HFX_0315 [Haloferax mediterranei ATCC 33500]AHZ22533.1 hypothetical protein BM92_07670 [Haloferax mediterranei ATCC 33500]EMA02670.1 hypothetical protein C439_08805 [Haloferax mediterranei ATCC 33500]MDX5988147.1 DUF502 domain-containing protein [Haloferax mediterranei ATCC 33500]QCQ74594.1 DUF502 domain-containing protein [Haloferax mediterranei ATCC 33500]
MSSWRRDFASGLVVLVPLIVIIYIFTIFYNSIIKIPFVSTLLTGGSDPTTESEVFGFFVAIIIFVLLVLSVGYLMRTTVGRVLESGIDAAMNKVPLVRIVYNASKLAVETALTGTEDLQKPVRLETWPGIRMTAFKTGKKTADGREIVFMPTAPNITTGFVMEVDPDDIEETGEKVEEALTRVLSAGFAEQDHIDEFNIEVTEESTDGQVTNE